MNFNFFTTSLNKKIMLYFVTVIFAAESFAFSIGNAKTIYYPPRTKDMDIPISIHYKLAALRLKNKTIIEYPVLLNSTNNSTINSINKSIKDSAYSYLENMDYYYNDHDLPDDVTTRIIAASAGIFGVDIPTGEGNASTGYGLLTYSDRHIWDLESGKDLINIYDVKTYSIKKDKKSEFWKTVLASNPIETMEPDSEYCKGYDADRESFSLFTNTDTLRASDLPEDGVDYHQGCGHAYDVPYDKVKNYIIFDKTFIKFLPKFIASGLVNSEFGKKILSDQK